MKVAIPTWNGRVSPVLDVARRLLVVDIETNAEVARREADLDEPSLAGKFKRIRELGADLLICGAVSQPLEAMLVSAEVRVIPRVCGPVEDVLRALLCGRLTDEAFLMPGCGRRCRRRRGRAAPGAVWGRSGGAGRSAATLSAWSSNLESVLAAAMQPARKE